MTNLPLAISIGDPAGIGPEIIASAWYTHGESLRGLAPFFVVGGGPTLEQAFRRNHGADKWFTADISEPAEAAEVMGDYLPVLDLGDAEFVPGKPSDESAALGLQSLAEATRCVLEGDASALVTAPVSKAGLSRVGFDYPGQTEFLAEVCGLAPHDAVMMLAGPSLRAIPLTVHVSLAQVPGLISSELITHKARIVAAALKRDFGIANPRLAIAGLNPHSGENGQFGNEEALYIAPAIAELRAEGMDVIGPVPGDALFTPMMRPTYDAALCMYHDQALIPLKALEFDQGVNVTLGLPIIRTSPDHGTAFDIAGTGKADASAMIAAIKMASQCAAMRANG